jgi:hypothetical protein
MQNSVVFSEAGNDYTRIEQLCNLLREIRSVGRAARSAISGHCWRCGFCTLSREIDSFANKSCMSALARAWRDDGRMAAWRKAMR